jgi:Cu(I)/Ag(I) efflux system membrane protein CusA/SilA
MRYGENALEVIQRVKEKLKDLEKGLPDGVEIVAGYDRSSLIERAVANLKSKLVEETIVVTLVCIIFLLHFRSAFVAIFTLPVGILISFLIMYPFGVNTNIISLGGIAITIVLVLMAFFARERTIDPSFSRSRRTTIWTLAMAGPALAVFS